MVRIGWVYQMTLAPEVYMESPKCVGRGGGEDDELGLGSRPGEGHTSKVRVASSMLRGGRIPRLGLQQQMWAISLQLT
jgi:hypothetical protein